MDFTWLLLHLILPQERNLLAMKKNVNSLLLIHNTDPKGLKFLFLFLSM